MSRAPDRDARWRLPDPADPKNRVWTEDDRKLVMEMALSGHPQDAIAAALHTSPSTLRVKFRHELDATNAVCVSRVAGRLYDRAMDGDVTAMIFFLKTRGGWSESFTVNANVNGELAVHRIDTTGLTKEELRQARELANKLKLPAASNNVKGTRK